MDGKILTLEGIYGQIVDAHEAHPHLHQEGRCGLCKCDIIGLEALFFPQRCIGCLQKKTLDTGQPQRTQVISRKVRRCLGEGTDSCWPHEQAKIKAINRQALLEEVAWRVEMRPSMRTQYQATDIGGITPLQLGYRSDCDLWITRVNGERW